MDEEIAYNIKFQVGDHLILELNSGDVFEGDYSDGAKNRIDLINTKQHNNPNKLGAMYSFYRNEIEKIHMLKKPATKTAGESITEESCQKIQITEDEYNRLKQMSKDFVYLENADSRYYNAINQLSEVETIGVMSLGMEEGRTSVLRLLVICTWKQVYIFDLVNLRKRYFYPELKELLESEYICKVMHGGGLLSDIIYRNYKVYIKNIFDTQVVDLIIQKTMKANCPIVMRNLQECLVEYFNFPSLLNSALETSNKKWMERPLCDKRRLYASQLVTYLIILKEKMQQILLSKVHKAINNVHNLYYNLSNYEFTQKMQNNKVTQDIDDVIPVLEAICVKNNDKN